VKTKLAAAAAILMIVLGVALTVVLAGRDDSPADSGEPQATSSPTPTEGEGADPDDPAYDVAVSETVEDSVYPNVGDPGVDSLHYDLDLAWDPEEQLLEGVAAIAFRATASAPEFRLDLGDPLEVAAARVDGVDVEVEHNGDLLVVKSPVRVDEKYLLEVEYAGTPAPIRAPTVREDLVEVGWTITDKGEVWTMQEPYGAFTWYPVNDQPADKALYDFTISVPAPWSGVANGELISREVLDGQTVTEWHLDTPASSYLVTIAIGDYALTVDETESGVPITYWTPRGDADALEALRFTPTAMAFVEELLGPYPFSTLGAVVVDSVSAMETQTMVTYGNATYPLSPAVMIHELTHQWYGDIVSPTDWRDVWMNEGMTMYIQLIWEAEDRDLTIDEVVDSYADVEAEYREDVGPPGAYDATMFGQANIYFGPALMWHELRQGLGDRKFWRMVREWPTVHAGGGATRDEYYAWLEEETGKELSAFFDAWIMGEETPAR
jgi:aminopeptidase N